MNPKGERRAKDAKVAKGGNRYLLQCYSRCTYRKATRGLGEGKQKELFQGSREEGEGGEGGKQVFPPSYSRCMYHKATRGLAVSDLPLGGVNQKELFQGSREEGEGGEGSEVYLLSRFGVLRTIFSADIGRIEINLFGRIEHGPEQITEPDRQQAKQDGQDNVGAGVKPVAVLQPLERFQAEGGKRRVAAANPDH